MTYRSSHSQDALGAETPESRAADSGVSIDQAHDDLMLETMRTVIVGAANQIAGLLGRVETAASNQRRSNQRRSNYVSPEALRVQGDLIRKERRDRRQHAINRLIPPGEHPVPGNLVALSALAEMRVGLLKLERTALRVALLCPIDIDYDPAIGWLTTRRAERWLTRPLEPSDVDLVESIVDLVHHIENPDWLQAASDELASIERTATRILDGKTVSRFWGKCPHCDRPTLVRHADEGLIRCEGDPHTGRQETCLCGDVNCGCTRGKRHEWHQGLTNGWQRLAGQIRHREAELADQARANRAVTG